MRPQIAIFGGTFNPPGLHHRQVAEELAHHFNRVIVVPSGERPDEQTTNDVATVFRAALADIAFRGLPHVEVDLFDLEQSVYSSTEALESRFAALGETWHVVGSDLITGGRDGQSVIQRLWDRGHELWHRLRFAVVTRPDHTPEAHDLPPQSKLITPPGSGGASAAIREKIFKRDPYQHLVTPEVGNYIERYGIYRGRIPSRATHWSMGEKPRLQLVFDERNAKAREWARRFEEFECPEDPTCILVIGGDGTMLRAVRHYWRRRVPFFGVNAGHLGFNLNDASSVMEDNFPPSDLIIRQLPLLYVAIRGIDGLEQTTLAFTDAWLERMSSQSAWLQVKVDDEVRIEKLVGDGALVSTAAGSTAYARSMGATPLLADTPGWLVVGSNVMFPPTWKFALLPDDAVVELEAADILKRPLEAFVDGQSFGPAVSLRARFSHIATAEIAFCSLQDIAQKIARIQFPPLGA